MTNSSTNNTSATPTTDLNAIRLVSGPELFRICGDDRLVYVFSGVPLPKPYRKRTRPLPDEVRANTICEELIGAAKAKLLEEAGLAFTGNAAKDEKRLIRLLRSKAKSKA